jgi:hypothetical protein
MLQRFLCIHARADGFLPLNNSDQTRYLIFFLPETLENLKKSL